MVSGHCSLKSNTSFACIYPFLCISGSARDYTGSLVEKERLRSFKTTLTEKKKVLQQQDDAIIEQVEKDEDIESEVFESGQFGESITRVLIKIDVVLNSTEINTAKHGEFSSVSPSLEQTVKSKLPKIDIKTIFG